MADFLSTVAAAWFSAGVIAPFFRLDAPFNQTLPLSLIGVVFAAVFLRIAMEFLDQQNYAGT